jgi:hypothetical protein
MIDDEDIRIVQYEIKYCNSRCPNFYYNYYDGDTIWCALLNRRIFNDDSDFFMWFDTRERSIPKDCPLPKKN